MGKRPLYRNLTWKNYPWQMVVLKRLSLGWASPPLHLEKSIHEKSTFGQKPHWKKIRLRGKSSLRRLSLGCKLNLYKSPCGGKAPRQKTPWKISSLDKSCPSYNSLNLDKAHIGRKPLDKIPPGKNPSLTKTFIYKAVICIKAPTHTRQKKHGGQHPPH